MKDLHFFLLFLACCTWSNLAAQTIKVQPYLQDATPSSIYILWETDTAAESIVEWGPTEVLGNTATGSAQSSNGQAMIHEVKLEGLERFSKYYYRVLAGANSSEVYHFKTPPFASDHESFRIIAMSDMQRDNSQPGKFEEVVYEGVIDYLTDSFGGDLVDNLAMVLIPGDLVVNGNNYSQWEEHFFDPAHDLFSEVPVYPVPGNHENNASYFFQYFKLPDNGTAGFEEHWWHKDYGNVRIIGLDSNSPFTNAEQLAWLDDVLDASCDSEDIDFVFAQLHHPHKSELWTPGESDYTGEVIARLEAFTADCGKPSIHFFGHTHGYSRGHSRDHKHLWINAATAGGAIDNWGEFPNFDYDEFAVSQDEYGFVSLEITDDADPKVIVKRISRGDQDGSLNNELTDSITIRLNAATVNTPTPLAPLEETIAPECVVLQADAFAAPTETSTHGQSHWQIATTADDFTNPVAESWKNFENWYFEQDTQAEDDLTDEKILGLAENTSYWWRVRYRDRELNWSDWSTPATFATGASIASPNLIVNPGAEDDLTNWSVTEGIVEALTDGICEGITPQAGKKYFAVGGLCEESAVGRCVQGIDVVAYADSIDMGNLSVNFGGQFSNFSGSDLPEMRLLFLDANSVEIGTSITISSLNSSWTMLSAWTTVPSLTRTIQVELKGTRNAGTDNDSYFDELFLRLGNTDTNCDDLVSVANPAPQPARLQVMPNPVRDSGAIVLPAGSYQNISLSLVDSNGRKLACPFTLDGEKVYFERGDLPAGTYFFSLREQGIVIGTGQLVFL